jgi:PAS domain S-box-containing protein
MKEKTIKVLLIEDNPDDAELLLRKLGKSVNGQLTVTSVKSLNDALKNIAQNKPDIVLSDLGLPDSHGLDTVTKIMCEAPNIPLVVLSGFDDEATAIKAVQSGAQDYLVKGQLEGRQIERSLFYAIERARLQTELEQHTQEISKIQANLLKILDKNADAIIVVGEDRQILFANPAAESLLGHRKKDLINKSFDFPVDGGKTSEIEIKHRGNEITTAEMNVVEINWEGKPAYLASLRNITKRKIMEEALKESESKFSKAFHSSANLFAINTLKDGKFIEINDSFTHMTGYTRKEVIGHNANDLNLWVTEEDETRIINKTRKNERVRNAQIKIRSKSGEIRVGLFSSEQITIGGEACFIHTITDITELKRAEESLRVSEEKFSKAFRQSPEVFVISSIDDGTILEANDSFLRLTGYTREEVIGRKSLELGTWAIPEERVEAISILKEKAMVSNREYHFRMKSGEMRTWLFSAEIINISDNPCMLSVTTDITERKKVEEKLRYSDTALNSIHEGVLAMDAEFKITRWNEMCEQMLGIKASDAIGKSAADVITMVEEYPGQNEKRVNLLLEKGFNKEEQIYRTPRGDIWVDVHAQAIEDNGKRCGWVSLLSDITDRKKAEEALRFSGAAFKSLQESVIATDNDFKITHWNEKSEKIYGIKAAKAIGRKFLDVIEMVENHPGENDRRFKMLENNGYYQEEQLHRTKYGEVWVDISVQAIEENGKRYGWVILASVITKRKLAEEALKRSEEKYRELISTSTDGIVSNDSQMRINLWNQGAEKIFGYKEKEMLGQHIFRIIPEKDIKRMENKFAQLRKTSSREAMNGMLELVGLRKNGSYVPIELSLSIRKNENAYIATAIIRDITERKEAEEKLRESEERYRDLFENASDLIQSCNVEGKFVYVNKAWRDALGYSEKEVFNLNFWDIIHPDYVAHCKQTLQGVMSGETINNIETAFVAKDGRLIQVEGNVNPVRKEEKVVATRAIFRDINVRKEAEEKLRKIDQMKSEFLSNVSHEIRTPLQSIGGFTKLIMNGQVPDAATQQEFLQIIDRETLHLGNLINGLLDMSRLESGRFQINRKLIPIRDTIIDSVKSFHTLARDKKITLNEEIPAELPEMEVDGERMRQVFINLLSNAIKYSDPGGSVTFRAEKHEKELLFQVSDRGIGMSPEAMQHLFERFYRAEDKLARGGTGLGLYIAKQIVEAHGGHIWVESKTNEGSTFSFNLPFNGKGGNGHGKENPDH